MKTLPIIAFGLVLVSTGALADHTTGLAAHRAHQQSVPANATTSVGVAVPGVAVIHTSRSNQPIITDPMTCLERFGEGCIIPERQETELDLRETDLGDHDKRDEVPAAK